MRYIAIKENDDIAGTRYDFFNVDDNDDFWSLGYASMSRLGDWEGYFDTKKISFLNDGELDYWAKKHGYSPIEISDDCTYGVSFDNGNTFESLQDVKDDLEYDGIWDNLVDHMDDHVREAVHDDIAPCTREEFLGEYLNRCGTIIIG